MRSYFLDAEGAPLAVCARLSNPAYAATLRAIAAGGADAFYRGAIPADIVATLAAASDGRNGLALDDFARYRAIAREPVCGAYRGYRICGPPAPTSGTYAVLQMLGVLAPYD